MPLRRANVCLELSSQFAKLNDSDNTQTKIPYSKENWIQILNKISSHATCYHFGCYCIKKYKHIRSIFTYRLMTGKKRFIPVTRTNQWWAMQAVIQTYRKWVYTVSPINPDIIKCFLVRSYTGSSTPTTTAALCAVSDTPWKKNGYSWSLKLTFVHH